MWTVLTALRRAARDLLTPRVMAVLFLPMLAAILLWCALAFFFWDSWTAAFRALTFDLAPVRWLAAHGATWLVEGVGVAVIVVVVVPAIVITAVVMTELVAMPTIVSVASREHPALERRKGGTIVGSLANAALAILIFAILWIVTLPLWLTGIGAVIVPALNSAYLNQRLFPYDALAEHAERDEYLHVVSRNRIRLFGLGLIVAPLYYVPVVNLAAPVIAGLAFTHFCLLELADLRQRP